MASVKQFVSDCQDLSVGTQRTITEDLSSLGYWNGDIHQLLPYPLTQYLESVLKAWVLDEPQNYIPHRWLGYITGDIEWYEKAMEINPKDDLSIYRVTLALIGDVEFQTHHLSESSFIGETQDSVEALDKAIELNDNIESEKLNAYITSEVNYYQRLLDCWLEYSKVDRAESFPTWCTGRGEEFNFWSIVYYDS